MMLAEGSGGGGGGIGPGGGGWAETYAGCKTGPHKTTHNMVMRMISGHFFIVPH
ncbi:MAG: hypothetical protein JSW20_09775 [Nitrospiraceae bacterium]|nr:MAG: hypothetical protein JSW20_09775 [Nitrospiraceae bacterium]